MQVLMERGADVNHKSTGNDGRTAVQARALVNFGVDVNAEPADGTSRIGVQVAAKGGHLDLVKVLLGLSADINAGPAYDNGRSALQAARPKEGILTY